MFENISGYKFVVLENLPQLQTQLKNLCERLHLKGTILLSTEGINVMLAGQWNDIIEFEKEVKLDDRFSNFWFKHSQSQISPFDFLKIRIKPEIITFCVPDANPNNKQGNYLEPIELKSWYENGKDFVILDTRNQFEIEFGAFDNAKSLRLDSFTDLPEALEAHSFDKSKPIVTYCTGGVRCEKATLLLEKMGFNDVYQLEGGILNYFEQCGGDYYNGECFVFDNRIAIDPTLRETGTLQCSTCFGPVTREHQNSREYVPGEHCPRCFNVLNKKGEVDVIHAS
jgi:predicted sulfurtransferase